MFARELKQTCIGHRPVRAGDTCHPRALVESCIRRRGQVAMLAWELQRALSGDQPDVEVNTRFWNISPCRTRALGSEKTQMKLELSMVSAQAWRASPARAFV
eukprot:8674281-Pyramimonas_sp.AAC.1